MTRIRGSWVLLAVSGIAGCDKYTCLDTATCHWPDVDAGNIADSGVETQSSDASATESSKDDTSEAGGSEPPTATSTADYDTTSGRSSETPAESSSTSTAQSSETSVVDTEHPADTSTAGSSASTGATGPTSTASEPASSSTEETSVPADTTSAPPEPTGDPNPSGFPEPGAGGVARPSGAVGGLTLVNWAGFDGALSYTFDDATGSQHGNKAAMFGLGVEFTWYLANGAGGDPMNAMYAEARDLGHELGNHTQNHTQNASDADAMQGWLMDNYEVVGYTMAAPNGSTTPFTAITNETFLLDRGVSGSAMGPDGPNDWTNLPSSIPAQGAGESVFKAYADTAAGGKWQTICIHGFTTGGNGGYQPVSFDGWKAGVEYAKTKNIWITSMVNVAAYIIGGKAVKNATVSAEGGGQKYTWTLKDTFPPGHYVRVTVTGGKLSQGGVTLPWNEHGFYEVSLDEGELTLRP